MTTLRVAHERVATAVRLVEHGRNVADVRLVPLPHDRVALVTDEAVSFVDPGLA